MGSGIGVVKGLVGLLWWFCWIFSVVFMFVVIMRVMVSICSGVVFCLRMSYLVRVVNVGLRFSSMLNMCCGSWCSVVSLKL